MENGVWRVFASVEYTYFRHSRNPYSDETMENIWVDSLQKYILYEYNYNISCMDNLPSLLPVNLAKEQVPYFPEHRWVIVVSDNTGWYPMPILNQFEHRWDIVSGGMIWSPVIPIISRMNRALMTLMILSLEQDFAAGMPVGKDISIQRDPTWYLKNFHWAWNREMYNFESKTIKHIPKINHLLQSLLSRI